ncbi:MAG: hypothetical protein ABFC34_14000 [Methanobacterium sp.]
MAVGTRDAIYYKEIDFPLDINHASGINEYSAKWRFEFIPAGGLIDENPINVEYNEFPNFVFMTSETAEINSETFDGIPYGIKKAEEAIFTIDLGSFNGDWCIVRNFITDETINLGASPATIRFNQWKIWRQKLDGTYKLYFWGCQTGMGGYPEWSFEGVKTYQVKMLDVFRAISGKVTIAQLISDMIDNLTFSNSDTVYQNYTTTQVNQSERARHIHAGSAYYSLTVRQIFQQIVNSLNARAKYPLTITKDIFHFEYEFPFLTFYKQNEDETTLGAAIDFLDCHRICYYSNDGGNFDGLFYNENGWQKYPTVWDLLFSTSKSIFSKLDYTYDQNNEVKMAFFNCMALVDYDRAVPEVIFNIENPFVKSEKIKQRSKIFGASIAHYMNIDEKDADAVILNNTNYTMISESQEEEMEFNINKSFCTKNDGANCYEFRTLPIHGLFYQVGAGLDKLCMVHDYCEFDSGYANNVTPSTISDVATYGDLNDINTYNAYIYNRQLTAGIGYVWALCNNLAFSGKNQAVLPMELKIISADDLLEVNQKYTMDIDGKFGLENFAQFNNNVFVIKRNLKLFELKENIELLIRGDL